MATYYYYPVPNPQFHYYDMMYGIYQNMINTFNQYPQIYNLRIKSSIDSNIMDKLNSIKLLEQQLTEALINKSLKEKLQSASGGIIDPSRIPDEALPELLNKHANLLGLTSTYNDKVKELSDTFAKINKILIDRSAPLSVSVRVPIDGTYNVGQGAVPWTY